MSVHPDPVWPWSHLWEFLSSAGTGILLWLGLTSVLLLLFPWLWQTARGRKALRVGGLVLVVLLLYALKQHWSDDRLGELVRGLGLSLLILVPLALIALTIATYLGTEEGTTRRVAIVLVLRLGAFALALIAIFRPSLGFSDSGKAESTLHIVLDDSESMAVLDMFGQSRWDYLLRIVGESAPLVEKLREDHQIEVVFHRFSADVKEFNPNEPGKATGSRTDFGAMLRTLLEQRGGEKRPAGLLILSDGADNGTAYPALGEAARWRGVCPIHTFALGKETTGDSRNDVAIVSLRAEPLPVPIKGEMKIHAVIDAPGFKEPRVRLRLFLEEEEVKAEDAILHEATGNQVTITCTAPSKPGDVMVKLRVEDPRREGQPLPGEVSDKNNEKITFVPVTKEGFSVLMIVKQRAFEPQMIDDVLRSDPKLNLHTVWFRGDEPVDPNVGDLFQLNKKQYDVIILGDVTPEQILSVNPGALGEIAQRVQDRAGLLVLGGYASFGPDWVGTPIAPLLPVRVGSEEQIEKEVQMIPTEEGLRTYSYVLGLGSSAEESRRHWQSLPKLQGMNRLQLPTDRTLISVLAESEEGDPILVSRKLDEKGRVLAFAGDTTHRWIRSEESERHHRNFWLQTIRWLGRQDETEGSVWVRPDTRNLPLRSDLGFSVGLRTKNGVELKGGTFQVKVHTPDGKVLDVPTAPRPEGERGAFEAKGPDGAYRTPGVYRIEAVGEGKSPDGEDIRGTGTARFVIEDDEVEKSRQAADHVFLKKLATSGGGEYHQAGDLKRYLEQLQGRQAPREQLNTKSWPTWRTNDPSPFFVLFFLLFVALVSVEWVLRRKWGMV